MVSFYFVLSTIFVLLICIRMGLFFSKTKLTINNIKIYEKKIKIDAQVSLYIFDKFKILTIKLNENGIKIGTVFISYNKIIKKVNPEEFVIKNFKPIRFDEIKRLNILLEKMHIECKFGSEDMFITVGVITFFSIVLSVFLANKLSQKENGKLINKRKDIYNYKIVPEFGKNIFELNGDLSLSFKTRRISIFLNSKEHTKFKILVGG